MNDIINPGFRFKNGSMNLTVLCFTEVKHTNLTLAVCSDDGLFITFRNLRPWNGAYIWDWGHYISDIQSAVDDYEARKKDL